MAAIQLRILGYAVTLAMHAYNLVTVNSMLEGPAMEDHNVQTFVALYKRFFTVWTMFLQIFHAVLGIVCDYHTLKNGNKKPSSLLKLLKSSKDRIFAAVLWPTVFLVTTLFWSLYHYDRGLIYPPFADKVLTTTSNHIFHTAIVPMVVWEALFQPRAVPKSHTTNIALLTVYMLTYLSVMYYTYIDQSVWLYPIFGLAYNTMFCFPLIIAMIGVMLLTYYRMQWFITRLVYSSKTKVKI